MMKVQKLFVVGVFLSGMLSISQAQESPGIGQGLDISNMPIIKSLFHGFDILDIGRGMEGEIDVELSGSFLSRNMWHGIDLMDDHGIFVPVGTVIFGDSGFAGKIIDAYPLSGDVERLTERHFAGFYTSVFWEDTPWATNFTLNYFYNVLPKISAHKNDTQEVGSTFFWPKLFALGNGYVTPSYYVGYIWASRSKSNMRQCEGFLHIFGFNYDFEIPALWTGGHERALRLSGDITYNDGYGGAAIEHDWSHAVLGISTDLRRGNLTITPMLNYQISMEDTINTEDELWSGINMTYRF